MKETNSLIEPGFDVPDSFPICRLKSVIVKQIHQGEIITDSGIVIPDQLGGTAANRSNTNRPNVGIIYAVGGECPPDLYPGLRIYYNQYVDSSILIEGKEYVMMHEQDVYFVLKPKNYVRIAVKDSNEVRRIKKHAEQASYFERKTKKEQNEKDQKEQVVKKLIKKK